MTPHEQTPHEIERVLEKIRRCLASKRLDRAEMLGAEALVRHPFNPEILREHAETAVRRRDWPMAVKRLRSLLALQGHTPARDDTVVRLAALYVGLNQRAEAELQVSDGLGIRPDSLILRKCLAEIRLLRPDGRANATNWRDLAASPALETADAGIQASMIASCAAGLRLAGLAEEAREYLDSRFDRLRPEWPGLFENGYCKLVIFDNGRTRIEYHAKLFDPGTMTPASTDTLVVTFDTMSQTWKMMPYAFKPLSATATDFLSVRKASAADFHQDFPREDFLRVATPVAANYARVMAIGQSLGGYGALYYATWLPRCRVLATAPRNPQNPKYANRKNGRPDLFRHEYDMEPNPEATPTIVYDPKNGEDSRYAERCLRRSFPNAVFQLYPYCGHSIAIYLLEIGILKSCTLDFLDGLPFPEFDRTRRRQSAEYHRNLAKMNFSAGRKRWAFFLLQRALELDQRPERTKGLMEKFFAPQTAVPGPRTPLATLPFFWKSKIARVRKWIARKLRRIRSARSR